MQIKSINFLNSISFNDLRKPNTFKKCSFDTVSFERKYKKPSGNELIQKIGINNFPSENIVKTLQTIGDDRNFNLYDVHIDYYKDLLECVSLDEAKEKYPEFKDVVDAKDINIDKLSSTYLTRKIMENGISFDNLSLELLKKYYGSLHALNKKDVYFGLSYVSVENVFKLLNIKKINKDYAHLAACSNIEVREKESQKRYNFYLSDEGKQNKKKLSENMQKKWAEDDGTMRERVVQAAIINSKALQTPESRAKNKSSVQSKENRERQRENTKKRWAEDDGTMRERTRQAAIINLHTPQAKAKHLSVVQSDEYRQNMSEVMCAFYDNHPEYIQAQQLAWQRHPEIRECMSEIAKKYPAIGSIIHKIHSGQHLSDAELKLYRIYNKETINAMPDSRKVINQEYHNILVEWGIIDE